MAPDYCPATTLNIVVVFFVVVVEDHSGDGAGYHRRGQRDE
jgi:hypothetical protein